MSSLRVLVSLLTVTAVRASGVESNEDGLVAQAGAAALKEKRRDGQRSRSQI